MSTIDSPGKKSPEKKETPENVWEDIRAAIVDHTLDEETGGLTVVLSEAVDAEALKGQLEDLRIFADVVGQRTLLLSRNQDVHTILRGLLGEEIAKDRWQEVMDLPASQTPLFFGAKGYKPTVETLAAQAEARARFYMPRDVYEEVQKATAEFLYPAEKVKIRRPDSNLAPNLRQFPVRYRWFGSECVDLKTGEHWAPDELRSLIAEAQRSNDPEVARAKKGRILHMSTGLAVRQLKIFRDLYPFTALYNADDVIQEALSGLSHALEKFDPERGSAFSTYAMYWINQRISRYRRLTLPFIHAPVHVQEAISTYRSSVRDYHALERKSRAPGASPLQRTLTEYVAERMKMTPKGLDDWKEMNLKYVDFLMQSNTVSIDAGEIIEEELDAAMRGLEDAFEDETESTGDMKKRIEQIFENVQLPPYHELVMRLRFGIVPEQPYTLTKLKEILGTVKNDRVKAFLQRTEKDVESIGNSPPEVLAVEQNIEMRMLLYIMGLCSSNVFSDVEESERTGGFLSLENVGQLFNITRERIRQIEAKSLPRMLLASRRPKQAEVLARLRKLVEEGPSIGTAHKIESKKEAPETLKIKTAIAGLAAYAKYSDRKIALLLTAQTEEFHKAQDIRAMREQLPDLTGYQETQSAESFQKFISSFFKPEIAEGILANIHALSKATTDAALDEAPSESALTETMPKITEEIIFTEDQLELIRGLHTYYGMKASFIRAFLVENIGVSGSMSALNSGIRAVLRDNKFPIFSHDEFHDFVEVSFSLNLVSALTAEDGPKLQKWTDDQLRLVAGLWRKLPRRDIAGVLSVVRGRNVALSSIAGIPTSKAMTTEDFVMHYAPPSMAAVETLFEQLTRQKLEVVLGRILLERE